MVRGEQGALTPRRHVLRAQNNLHRDKRDLHARACPEARQNLVPDPTPRTTRHAQRIQHSTTDGEDGGSEPHKGRVPAERGDAAADDDGGQRDADEIGDGADAGAFGRGAFDGLEVEGQVVDVRVETHGDEAGESGAGADGALGQDAWGDGRSVAESELHGDEDGDDEAEAKEAAPDSRVTPRVEGSAPLQC